MAQSDGTSSVDLGLTPRILREAEEAGVDVGDILGDDNVTSPILVEATNSQPEASADVDGEPDGKQEDATEDQPPVEAAVKPEPEAVSAAPKAEPIDGQVGLEEQLGQARNVNRTLQAEKDRHLTRVKELEAQEFERRQADEKANVERLANMSDVDKVGWVDQMVELQRQPVTTQQLQERVESAHYEKQLVGLRNQYPDGDAGTKAWQTDINQLSGPEDVNSLMMRLAQEKAKAQLVADREATAVAAAAEAKPSEGGVVDTGATPGRKVMTYDQLAADFNDPDSSFGEEEDDLRVVLEAGERERKKFLSQHLPQRK